MKSFLHQTFQESFYLGTDDLVHISYADNGEKDIPINLKFGKKDLVPYKKKIAGVDLYVSSLYTALGDGSTDLLKMLKAKKISPTEYSMFLKRSAVYTSYILKDLGIDIIVTPKSSSTLTNDFVRELQARNTGIKFIYDSFQKAKDPSEIKVDYGAEGLKDKTIKTLESSIRRGVREGYFQMKWILPQNRKFLLNLFSYNGNAQIFEGKKVLIVDDVVSSGSSLVSIYRTAQEAGAESVNCLALFKTN